jgi:hypothetical protein
VQIGYVALADGQLRLISRDTNSYATLSLSADGKMLATVQQKVVSNFYVLPGNGSTSADISSSGSAMTSRHAHCLWHIQGMQYCPRLESGGASHCTDRRYILPGH